MLGHVPDRDYDLHSHLVLQAISTPCLQCNNQLHLASPLFKKQEIYERLYDQVRTLTTLQQRQKE